MSTPAARLYLTDAECAKRIGIDQADAEATFTVWQRQGFPERDPQVGNKRYWPAVQAFLDRRAGLHHHGRTPRQDGAERW